MSRSNYRKQTRKNVCIDYHTYAQLLEVKSLLEEINCMFPFTDKVISQHDTVKFLCQFFENNLQEAMSKQGTQSFLKND